MKKRAFTLVELMVVLAIIALLSALIFGAISSVREGNKRGSCQGNLNAIYAAARLYGQDNDGQFPYRNDKPSSIATPPLGGGIGLWSLYVYAAQRQSTDAYNLPLPLSNNDAVIPAPSDVDQRKAATLASYLKAPRAFHCPSDNFDKQVDYNLANGTTATTTVSTGKLDFLGADNRRHFNPYYLSYGTPDDQPVGPTYSSFRGQGVKRQLRYLNTSNVVEDRRSPDQTIVTWCHFHRSLDADGNTKPTDFSRTFDNVLFLDGSVQSVPVEQSVTLANGSASAVCRGWKRVPLAEANAVPQYVIDACNATP